MCGLIIGLFIMMLVISIYAIGIAALVVLVILIGLIASIGNLNKAKKLKASKMECPNCGSRNIRIQKEFSGMSSNSTSTYVSSWHIRSGNHSINRQRVAVCQDCGFDYPYITQDEIDEQIEKAKGIRNLFVILTALLVIVGLILFWNSDSSKDDTPPQGQDVAVVETVTQEETVKESGCILVSEFDYMV